MAVAVVDASFDAANLFWLLLLLSMGTGFTSECRPDTGHRTVTRISIFDTFPQPHKNTPLRKDVPVQGKK
jgi:hypothetical protein